MVRFISISSGKQVGMGEYEYATGIGQGLAGTSVRYVPADHI